MSADDAEGLENLEEGTNTAAHDRRTFVLGCDLSPASLVGSWFIAADEWGLVVGEPQPGMYLVELIIGVRRDLEQRVATLREMHEDRWRFYDTKEAMDKAFAIDEARRREGVS